MNLVFRLIWRLRTFDIYVVLLLVGFGCLPSCFGPKLTTVDRFAEFEQAGPIRPKIDHTRLINAKMPVDSYRVVAGDVLELHMPVAVRGDETVTPESIDQTQEYLRRISKSGSITLPMVGHIQVAGKYLSEIESAIVHVYYPKYITEPPSIIVRVFEYHTETTSIVGAVKDPGVYQLQNNEMSLVTLLMKAGGIVDDGAAVIRIRHSEDNNETEPLVLPVKEMNIPFADVVLARGDIVEVEPLDPAVFTVIGLVKKPGAFPYPPGIRYNVLQALAFAGGMNEVAAPRYVRVYRQKADGQVIDATFKIRGAGIINASNVMIKQGDVISVEQTARTSTRQLLAQVFRVTFYLSGRADLFD